MTAIGPSPERLGVLDSDILQLLPPVGHHIVTTRTCTPVGLPNEAFLGKIEGRSAKG